MKKLAILILLCGCVTVKPLTPEEQRMVEQELARMHANLNSPAMQARIEAAKPGVPVSTTTTKE